MRTKGCRHPSAAPRRRVALLATFVLLLQAVLFGWHHHPLRFPAVGGHPAASAPNATQPLSPATAPDSCAICATLQHQSAAPFDSAALPLPSVSAATIDLPDIVFAARATTRGFRARAPPAIESVI